MGQTDEENGAIEPGARVTWLMRSGGEGRELEAKTKGANEPRVSVRKLQLANPTNLPGNNMLRLWKKNDMIAK